MRYIETASTEPAYNHAVEKYFVHHTDDDVFMLWQNRPSVLIGKNQTASLEVDFDYTRACDITVVRRLSGGGTIFCDLNNMQYSFITKRNRGRDSFSEFAKPVISALRALGLDAEFTGRNDIILDGKKISGNAQYKTGNRILHHGTLIYSIDSDALKNSLISREIKFVDKSVKSVVSRVGQICDSTDLTITQFIDHVKCHIMNYHGIKQVDIVPKDAKLQIDQYIKDFPDLNHMPIEKLPKYYAVKHIFGVVEYALSHKDGVIVNFVIAGDFFAQKDIGVFCDKMIGTSLGNINQVSADIGDYIEGMTKSIFMDDIRHLLDTEF